jgi:hypothetical protein
MLRRHPVEYIGGHYPSLEYVVLESSYFPPPAFRPGQSSKAKLIISGRLSTDGLPMIIMACKSDPGARLEVEAAYGNSLGEAYNVGLIEVTEVTEEGKSKMRNGMRWLLYKLEQRSRECCSPL